MRIGVFDSGLGGLLVARAIERKLPQYDYLYLGDTKRVPYGNRSQQTIHQFVAEALDYLFKNDCQLIVLACNTASAESLRRSQREYLPTHYPGRNVLGVVIPMAEAAIESLGLQVAPMEDRTLEQPAVQAAPVGASGYSGVISQPDSPALRVSQGDASPHRPPTVGILATVSTVESGAYARELGRCYPGAIAVQQPAPLLVPLIENDGLKYIEPVLEDYMAPLTARGVQCLILGCTHYAVVKDMVRSKTRATVVSADEVVPEKLADYLRRHPEIESKLSRDATRSYQVTDLTDSYLRMAHQFAGEDVNLQVVSLG